MLNKSKRAHLLRTSFVTKYATFVLLNDAVSSPDLCTVELQDIMQQEAVVA
jgi:hypothetical protein